MKQVLIRAVLVLITQCVCISNLHARNVFSVSGWEVEVQDDGTCALGKTYEFGPRDALIVAITSFGQVSVLADKEFTGNIDIDGQHVIRPVRSIGGGTHMYSDSNDRDKGKVFVTYFKLGNVAKIKLKNGQVRELPLNGFTKAYNQYKKCAR